MRAKNIIRHGKDWKLWVPCDRDPNERWVDGRVALLGDAAHPMLQYFAHRAMEDALCLSHVLAQRPDEPRSSATARNASRAPRGYSRCHVRLASRSIIPPGSTLASATPLWAPRRRRIITAILAWLCDGAGLGVAEHSIVVLAKRSASPDP